jgi:hypothetical protein
MVTMIKVMVTVEIMAMIEMVSVMVKREIMSTRRMEPPSHTARMEAPSHSMAPSSSHTMSPTGWYREQEQSGPDRSSEPPNKA